MDVEALGNRVFKDNNTDVEGEAGEGGMVLLVSWDWRIMCENDGCGETGFNAKYYSTNKLNNVLE